MTTLTEALTTALASPLPEPPTEESWDFACESGADFEPSRCGITTEGFL